MAIIKEYRCLAHGDFDSPSLDDGSPPGCPHGCGVSMVQRVYRTAPMIQTQGYRNINSTFQRLAEDHGLSDMSNRNAVQDGTGMRRADAATHARLNRATEMVMGSSRSGNQGQDASQFFQPLGNFQPGSTGEGGALQRVGGSTVEMRKGGTFVEGGTLMSGQTPLLPPKPKLDAPAFNGGSLGLPAGDA